MHAAGVVLRCPGLEVLVHPDWSNAASQLVATVHALALESWRQAHHPGWGVYRGADAQPRAALAPMHSGVPYATDCAKVAAAPLAMGPPSPQPPSAPLSPERSFDVHALFPSFSGAAPPSPFSLDLDSLGGGGAAWHNTQALREAIERGGPGAAAVGGGGGASMFGGIGAGPSGTARAAEPAHARSPDIGARAHRDDGAGAAARDAGAFAQPSGGDDDGDAGPMLHRSGGADGGGQDGSRKRVDREQDRGSLQLPSGQFGHARARSGEKQAAAHAASSMFGCAFLLILRTMSRVPEASSRACPLNEGLLIACSFASRLHARFLMHANVRAIVSVQGQRGASWPQGARTASLGRSATQPARAERAGHGPARRCGASAAGSHLCGP